MSFKETHFKYSHSFSVSITVSATLELSEWWGRCRVELSEWNNGPIEEEKGSGAWLSVWGTLTLLIRLSAETQACHILPDHNGPLSLCSSPLWRSPAGICPGTQGPSDQRAVRDSSTLSCFNLPRCQAVSGQRASAVWAGVRYPTPRQLRHPCAL